eukprot:6525511-Heterocapsa_arctica.AAC.1
MQRRARCMRFGPARFGRTNSCASITWYFLRRAQVLSAVFAGRARERPQEAQRPQRSSVFMLKAAMLV